jgi:hypothetical protein
MSFLNIYIQHSSYILYIAIGISIASTCIKVEFKLSISNITFQYNEFLLNSHLLFKECNIRGICCWFLEKCTFMLQSAVHMKIFLITSICLSKYSLIHCNCKTAYYEFQSHSFFKCIFILHTVLIFIENPSLMTWRYDITKFVPTHFMIIQNQYLVLDSVQYLSLHGNLLYTLVRPAVLKVTPHNFLKLGTLWNLLITINTL